MKSHFAYLRVSTQKQGKRGVSLHEQRAAIERYAARAGLAIARWFEERETAAKGGRPVFARMLQQLRAGEAAGVIIHKIDRSARNLKDWADLGELIDAGVEIHFATESLDLNSRGGRLSADIQAVVAADYVRNLREEARKGFYGRLKQGVYPLPAPIGYRDCGAGQAKAPDPVTAPLIRQAFELYATGAHTLETLNKELHRRGLRNRNGGRISRSGLSLILNNPFYIGLIRISSGETFRGAHEPIVSPALFKRVQAVLNGRNKVHTPRHDFLFRRLLRCAHCSHCLVGERQKGHVYYRCHTRGCPTTGVREDHVEPVVRDVLGQAMLTPDECDELRAKLAEHDAALKSEREQAKAGLQLAAARQGERLDRLTDALLDGLVDKATFERRKARLEEERLETQEKLDAYEQNGRISTDRLERFLEFVKSLQSSYDSGFPADKRDLLAQVTSNRVVAGKNVHIELREPFAALAKRQKTKTVPRNGTLLEPFGENGDSDVFETLCAHFELGREAGKDA